MELKDIIQLFMSNKKTYGIITLIALVFGIIVVTSIPKQYTAKVMLSPETNNDMSKLGGLGSIASSMGLNMNNSNTDAIGPQFYPNVVSSTSFIVGLFDIKIKSDDGKIKTSLYDYLKNYQKSPWWSMLNPLGWIATTEKSETNNKKIDAFRLTENQTKIVTNLKGMISCSVDQETNIITIKVTAQDPLISAVLVDSVSNRLQAFITDYRTSKAKHDLAYTKKLYVEALADYKKSQEKFAAYSDANEDVILQSYKSRQDELENDMQLRYNIYTQLVQQLQLAKAKVMERTPVYAVIEAPTVPTRPSAPHKLILLVLFLIVFNAAYTAFLIIKTLKVQYKQ